MPEFSHSLFCIPKLITTNYAEFVILVIVLPMVQLFSAYLHIVLSVWILIVQKVILTLKII